MSVFRIEKSSDYTVISNHHLRNRELSLRAKGLLSQILSLPNDWDYTIAGLAAINKEGKDAVRVAVQELEAAGYIVRRQKMDSGGKFGANEYIVYETPRSASPLSDFPTTEKPSTEKPLTENPTELNKDKYKKKNKRKKTSEKPEPLTDEELRPLVVSGINGLSKGNWSAAVKNDLYKWVMALYDPTRTVRKAHPVRSKLSVDGTFRKLALSGDDPQVMISMLCTAIEGGWQGVQVPSQGKRPAPQNPAREERQYRCL